MDNSRLNEQNNSRDNRDNFKSIQASGFLSNQSSKELRDDTLNQELQNRELRDNFKNIDKIIDSMHK